jgi:MFS family permease
VKRTQDLGDGFGPLWTATALTAVGAQATSIALPLLAVLTLDASTDKVGLLATVQWLPFLIIALPLGVLFDRTRRRPLLIAAEVGRAIVLLAIIILLFVAVLDIRLLLVLGLLLGCCVVVYEVGYQSYLPFVVPADRLDVANSRLTVTESVALIAGPGLGGLLVQTLTAAGALGLQVLTSLFSALALTRIRRPEPAVTTPRVRLLPAIAEGFRFLAREPVLRWAVGFSALYNPFEQWILVLFTVDAVTRLGLNAGQFGLVFSVAAVGTLLGAAVAPRVSRRIGALTLCLWCSAIDPIVFLALPALPTDLGVPALVALTGAVFAISGATSGLASVVVLTVRQVRVPDVLRGRVNATTRMISYGSITIGTAAGGFAGQLFGTQLGLAIGAVGMSISTIWTIGMGWPLLRRGVRIDAPVNVAESKVHVNVAASEDRVV